MTSYLLVDSAIGSLLLTATDSAITRLLFPDERGSHRIDPVWSDAASAPPVAAQLLRAAQTELEEYFRGERQHFTQPFAAQGTSFQQQVWSALADIPYAETRSYGQIARQIGNERAVRAVGLANGRNPISIIVPCHRVIGANGSLTGYGGGLERKEWLLALERRAS